MPEIRDKEKELRFTRSGQAVVFWIAAAVFAAAAIVFLSVSVHRGDNPRLPHGGWALLPSCLAWAAGRMAYRLTKHAYLILTPLGVEVFPFFRPADGMQLVYWGEIQAVDVDANQSRLTLHFNTEKSSGIHLSLRPVERKRRELLIRAVRGRVGNARI